VIAAGLLAAVVFGGQYLSFETAFDALRERREGLQAYVAEHRVLALLAFAGLYMLVTALSVPGATILTLAGGFLFGVWLGGAATVLGATAGAVLVFLAARAAAGDFLRRKAGPAVARIEQGVRENAFSYLLSLRLLPVLPFWLVNLASGFVDIPLRTYALATFSASSLALHLCGRGRRPGRRIRRPREARPRRDLQAGDPAAARRPGATVAGADDLEAVRGRRTSS
jgi:uncharacterized membrane protein YdjX (TVP38/TMEM64 family)